MDTFNSAESAIQTANQQLAQAGEATQQAKDWCLKANTANWESPAAAIFSRWLAELVLTSRQNAAQSVDLRVAAANV